MRPKGAKGGSPLALKARWVPNHKWAHLSRFVTMDPNPQVGPPEPVCDHGPQSTDFGQELKGPLVALFQPWPLITPRGHQLSSRGRFPIPPCTLYSRMQEWCIYEIIYHYAPFLLSNPMVTFSGPNYMIQNQGPKIHHRFRRRTLQLISLAIPGGYQKTISGPQPPGPAGVGLEILPRLFQGPVSEVIHHSISGKGSKYFNTPLTTQLVHTGSNQSYLYVLGPIGPIHNLLWEFNHTVSILKMARAVLTQFKQYSWMIHLPGSAS
ncbi:hypothetical protein O181_023696 [Austropuccinia psidii MF-1]|uniref:Uncharacterized protein n=1 Tax=Austropuccinia psidii MF-1 TaxID=1389203 RepID=A0A9Q3CJW8_9BASI|nr:hypothetical protein [Austropuccinia psidii MF-1]